MNISKENQLIISNYGIIGEVFPNGGFSVIHPYWDETFNSYADFCRKYAMSPICVIERRKIYNKEIFFFSNLKKEIEVQEYNTGKRTESQKGGD